MNNKRIFFTHIPYAGRFKYNDLFLIYPAPIQIEAYIRHKPAIIEYYTEETKTEFFNDPNLPINLKDPVPQFAVQSVSDQHKYNELLRLLTLLTNYFHFCYTGHQAWFVPIGSEKNDFHSATWGQEFVPAINKDTFCSEYEDIKKEESVKYYSANLFQRSTNTVIYPDSIEQLLDKYFELADSYNNGSDSFLNFND